MNTLYTALCDAWSFFKRNPLHEVLITACFLLACLSGIGCGFGAIFYYWHLTPKTNMPLPWQLLFIRSLQNRRVMAATFWLGLGISILCYAFSAYRFESFAVVPLLLIQPLWLALILIIHYELAPAVALKATGYFILHAPQQAFSAMLISFLSIGGIAISGVPSPLPLLLLLITLPIGMRTYLLYFGKCARELSIAIQKASL